MQKNLLAAFIAGVLFCCGFSFSSIADVAEGDSPALAVKTVDGRTFDTSALKGKVVIVHFWATWCASCREEMPALDDFYMLHRAQGFEVIAVSLDRPNDRDSVIKYMHDFHFPAGLISDTNANDFGSPRILPITYIMDTGGKVRKVLMPEVVKLTRSSLNDAVLPLFPSPPHGFLER